MANFCTGQVEAQALRVRQCKLFSPHNRYLKFALAINPTRSTLSLRKLSGEVLYKSGRIVHGFST